MYLLGCFSNFTPLELTDEDDPLRPARSHDTSLEHYLMVTMNLCHQTVNVVGLYQIFQFDLFVKKELHNFNFRENMFGNAQQPVPPQDVFIRCAFLEELLAGKKLLILHD